MPVCADPAHLPGRLILSGPMSPSGRVNGLVGCRHRESNSFLRPLVADSDGRLPAGCFVVYLGDRSGTPAGGPVLDRW